MQTPRHYSLIDRLLITCHHGLQTLENRTPNTQRPSPAHAIPETPLDEKEKKLSSALLRIDHAGEVCAQALYEGHALTARSANIRHHMQQAALEENDHLAWCANRLQELNSYTSYLNPFWYLGSLSLGIISGIFGDRWNLGFVAETEKQVVHHLDLHLEKIPQKDLKSHAILLQMKNDELKHATMATDAGAATLPRPIQFLMKSMSKIMTAIAYYI